MNRPIVLFYANWKSHISQLEGEADLLAGLPHHAVWYRPHSGLELEGKF